MVKHEFDKLILTFLLLAIIYILVFVTLPSEVNQWLREAGSGILGGLLGLITGHGRSQPQTAGIITNTNTTSTTNTDVKPE